MKNDYAFDKFLSDGGAESDTEVIFQLRDFVKAV